MRAIDLTGQRFGKLVALRRIEPINKMSRWLLACDCGKETEALQVNLVQGKTMSCGCGRFVKRNLERNTDEALYRIWYGIIKRCTDPSVTHYHRYGGRGITVCDEWMNSFEAFRKYVAPRPSVLHSIDRIDNDRGYEPGNVRWATDMEQQANRRGLKMLTVDGVTKHVSQWAREKGIKRTTLDQRIAKGLPLFGPVRGAKCRQT